MNQIPIALFVGMNIVFGTVFLSVGGFFLYAGLTNKPVWGASGQRTKLCILFRV